MPAGNIGSLSMDISMNDKTTPVINRVAQHLEGLIKGQGAAIKKFEDLNNAILDLQKSGQKVNGTTIKLSSGGARQAQQDLKNLRQEYEKLYNIKATAIKLNPQFDTTELDKQMFNVAKRVASFFKQSSSGNLLGANKNAIFGTYNDTAFLGQWKNAIQLNVLDKAKRVIDSTKKLNSEQQKLNNKAVNEAKRQAQQEEDTHKWQIKALKDYVIEHNRIIKDLKAQREIMPTLDKSRFDATIANMRVEVAALLQMLNQLGVTSYGSKDIYAKRYGINDALIQARAPKPTYGKTATYFDKNAWNNRDVYNVENRAQVRNTQIYGTEALARQREANLKLVDSLKASAAAQVNDEKANNSRSRQVLKLTGYIEQLERRQQGLQGMKFISGTDLSQLTAAETKLQGLIALFKQFRSEVESGKNMYDNGVLRFMKNSALGTVSSAVTYTNQSQRDTKQLTNDAVKAENLEATIMRIENKMHEVNSMIGNVGVSPQTNGELATWLQKLTDVRDMYRMIQGDASMLNDKLGMAKTATDMALAINGSKRSLESAKQEVKDYNTQLAEQKRAEKEAAAQNKQYASTMDNYGVKLQKLKDISARLREDISRGDKMKIDTSDLQRQLTEVLSLIKEYNGLVKSTPKSTILSGNAGSLDTKSAWSQLQSSVNGATQAFKKNEQAQKEAVSAMDAQKKRIAELRAEYERLATASKNAGNMMNSLKDMLYQFAPIYGVQQMVMSIIETGGEIEKQHIALQSILGDLENANNLFNNLKTLALQSPFTFGDLTKDVKQLAAYNVETDELYETTKRLADISSGLGVSFERIALAYGQVKSRSWLDAKELRQFAYAGLPLLQSLADMYSQTQGSPVSKADVRKMITNRQVSFEDVQKVMWDMTDEGGKFYNMQLVLSETLLGRYNKMKDAWEIMLSEFASGKSIVGGTFKVILDFITALLLNMKAILPIVTTFFAAFSLRKGVMALQTLDFSKATNSLKGLIGAFGGLKGLGITAVIAGIVEAFSASSDTMEKISDRAKEAAQRIKQIEGKLSELNNAERPNDDAGYKVAIEELKDFLSEKSDYFDYIEAEGEKIESLSEKYDYYIAKIKESKFAQDEINKDPGWATRAMEATGGIETSHGVLNTLWTALYRWGDDNLESNAKDWDKYDSEMQSVSQDLTTYYANIEEALDSFSHKTQGTIEERLQQITDSGWQTDFENSLNGDVEGMYDAVHSYIMAYQELNDAKNTLFKDVDIIGKEIDKKMKSWGVKDPKNLSAEQKAALNEYVKTLVNSIEGATDQVKYLIEKQLHIIRPKIIVDPDVKVKKNDGGMSSTALSIMNNVKKKYGNGVMSAIDATNIGGTGNNPKSYTEALNAIKDARQKAFEEYQAQLNANKIDRQALEKAKKDYEKWEKIADANGVKNDLKNKWDPSKKNGSRRDEELEKYKKRVSVIKELISQYQELIKWTDAVSANEKVNKAASEAGIATREDWSNGYGILTELAGQAPRGAKGSQRESYRQEVIVTANKKRDEDEKKAAEALAEAHKDLNEQLQAQYDLRKKIMSKYSSGTLGDSLTQGATTYSDVNGGNELYLKFDTFEQDLTNQLENALANKELNKLGKTFDEAMNAKKDELEKWFGTDVINMIKTLRQVRLALQQESVEAVLSQFESLEDESSRMQRISSNTEDMITKIRQGKYKDPEDQKRAEQIAKDKGSLDYYKASDDYYWFTNQIWSLDAEKRAKIMEKLLAAINKLYEDGGISLETYRKEVQAIDDAYAKLGDRDSVIGKMTTANTKRKALDSILGFMNRNDMNSYVIDTEDKAKKTGLSLGKWYTKTDIEDARKNATDDFNSQLDASVKGLQNFATALDPVCSLLDKIPGMGGFSNALGVAGSALSGATSMSGAVTGLAGLFGEKSGIGKALGAAGPYAAAAGAGLSIVTSLIGDVDADEQKEIEELQNINSTLEKMSDLIKNNLENYAGKIYSWTSADANSAASSIQSAQERSLENYIDSVFSSWGVMDGKYSTAANDAYKKALDTQSYYDTQLALLYAERDNYESMAEHESNKKDSDSSKIEEYKQSVTELEQEIKNFSKTMAEELYGIDIDSYAQNIASALMDAWAAGTNGVKAYKEAVKDAMKNVAQTVVQQKIIGTAIDKYMDSWLEAFEANGGIMDDNLFNKLGDVFTSVQESVDSSYSFLDAWNEIAKSHGINMKDSASSSLSSNVSGITEDTADLLASYLNAVMADVSINRAYLEKITEEQLDSMSTTLNASLITLQGIKTSIDSMSDIVSSIDGRLDDVIRGNKTMKVVMRTA